MVDTAPGSALLASSLLDAQSGELVLRIRGSSRHGQIVRLRSAKCTIGSGPQCTLRLQARGVRPLHCLVLRGAAATVIRRWAPDTRLNGRDFSDADLAPGDRLSVGPIELEVLQSTRPGKAPAAKTPAAKPQQPDRLQASLEAEKQAFAAQTRRWKAERAEADSQLNERIRQLDARQAKLDALEEAFERERSQWQGEHARIESDSAAQNQELDAGRSELETQRQTLQQQRDESEAERAEAEARLDDQRRQIDVREARLMEQENEQAEQLDTRRAELEAKERAVEEERDRRETEQAETEQQLNRQNEELVARYSELKAQRETFQQERDEWKSKRLEAELPAEELPAEPEQTQDPEFEAVPEDAPVDTADVFRRLGTVPLLPEDEEEQPAAEPEQVLPEPAGPKPAREDEEEDKDESIDDYMAKLMNRVRGITGEPSSPLAASQPGHSRRGERSGASESRASGTMDGVGQSDSPADTPPTLPIAPRKREPIELAPRAKAPEKSIDLSAMRELANISAKTAIDRHSRRLLSYSITGKMMVTAVALMVSTALIWMWWAYETSHLTLGAGILSLMVVLFWGVQYIALLGRRILGKTGHRNWVKGDVSEKDDSPQEASDETADGNHSQPPPAQ